MEDGFKKILKGYQLFKKKYAHPGRSMMDDLYRYGQQPKIMIIACCDARVDPALILQCHPGDLFVVRNVANIVPPYEKDSSHHGTSAALEFGICFLDIPHLIILGHSQCGGIKALLGSESLHQDDFITNWVSLIKTPDCKRYEIDEYAKHSLAQSYQNCLTFPWLQERYLTGKLMIHLWFFDIQKGQIYTYANDTKTYRAL